MFRLINLAWRGNRHTNMTKRWVFQESKDPEPAANLAKALNITLELADLLCGRNAESFEKARMFFRPSMDQLHDPFLMNDMDKAVSRIKNAIESGEKIMVFGDYDVDGTTAVSVVYSFLKSIYEAVDFYIPNRYREGYGISYAGIDWAEEHGITLIIALDCGIKSIEHVQYALDRKIEFIIADHHLPGDMLPAAVAVLDPKRLDSTYPFKELSGCGIGYKLVTALVIYLKLPPLKPGQYLDMLAVSIAADVVDVCDENRVLAFYGLKQLNENPCTGLKALIKEAGIKGAITFNEVLFQLGPRINAAGRMEDGGQVVKLLTAATPEEAGRLAAELNEHNNDRKLFDTEISAHALEMLHSSEGWQERNSTVLYHPNWHKGVIGIVASRVIEKHYRPTIILTESNGKATGSARSVAGFNIYNAIDSCSHLLDQFGGHQFAAGLSLDIDKVEEFTARFEEVVTSTMQESGFTRELKIDAEVALEILDEKFRRILFQFAPFGPANPQPVFMSRNLQCYETPTLIAGKHLKFRIRLANGKEFPCIGFNMEPLFRDLAAQKTFDMCYYLENNTWNGQTTCQLQIKDLIITN